MKYLVVATAAFAAAMSGDTFAADAAVKEVVAVDKGYSWSGIYMGANIGYGQADTQYSSFFADIGQSDPEIGDDFDDRANGILGGAQIGFNVQMNQFVLGVEADLQATGLSESVHQHYEPFGLSDLDVNLGLDINWISTVRGRLGIAAADRLLLYGTAGIAIAEIESNFSYNNDPDFGFESSNSSSSKTTRSGWVAGAGAEYAFTDNWSLKMEYLYVDLGKERDIFVDFSPLFGQREIDGDLTLQTVRLGVNYKF